MKKFTVKATALAIASVCGSAAFAGSITTPASDSAAVVYAAEALVATTDLTVPSLVYTMGVARTTAQDFTIILTPSSGATFTTAGCAAALPTIGGAGAATVSQKRSSATECAYEVDVTTAFTTATTLTFANLVFDTHSLNTAGNSASVTVALKDLGETAYIDNSGTLTRKVATSVQAINVYAATSDTGTTADVNATGGPLTGFLTANDDTATIAKAALTFDNNSANAKDATGAANFDFTATTGTLALTLTGTSSGVKANSFCIDLNDNSTLCETGEKLTIGSSSSSLSAIPSTVFPAQGTTATHKVSFEADGTTQLGTSRTFAVSGTITPQVGAAEALADTASKNATWWTWSANASQLMTPYISTNTQYVTRVSLLNTGTADVGYSVTCYTENGSTATAGANGTLKAGKTTIVAATDACTFSGAPRGAVMFTINAPINTVKGTYNIVDAVTGANGFVPLTRPYNAANTTE